MQRFAPGDHNGPGRACHRPGYDFCNRYGRENSRIPCEFGITPGTAYITASQSDEPGSFSCMIPFSLQGVKVFSKGKQAAFFQ